MRNVFIKYNKHMKETQYHTQADLSDYIDREIKLINPFFRLTKKSGLIASLLLIITFAYYVFKLIAAGIALRDPFADFGFGYRFIVMLIELDCIICLFPSFFKKEYSMLKFILVFLFISSILINHYIISIIAFWCFISVSLVLPAVQKGKLKYSEYCANARYIGAQEDNLIYKIPELTESADVNNGYAPPIDNSNLFKKKSIFDEEIELVDMDKVFKAKNNDPEQ